MKRLFVLLFLTASLGQAVDVYDFLADRMGRFQRDYNSFVMTLNKGKVFDLKLAKRLSKEWREVEECGEWPK